VKSGGEGVAVYMSTLTRKMIPADAERQGGRHDCRR
jgi:hypothetical protein